ncbi:MAG: hypothetical protein A2599_01985 [Candidatus Staskawiczbacteria bacterium RIFOXYD1_FULL_39_28]|uniref:Uncharacterized protein n=1 Tax=Candidatus Staskawiczbacteria bacterium RIFOXYC1_FULL_38_18 TaxID=1802229 RepID=A0A1G2JDE2_9BACT|nr:MAG: hypothetical protein A2401_02625 [Candidatus Staskawiczbacteria bacterium RIFOXYC1_FULL_38_18]OGZ91798.1 MAG: hypothetical protein A2599_01985 [Candidatus Staskawiczbacteria bacterium RIFOXYD1_FULL_39_28]
MKAKQVLQGLNKAPYLYHRFVYENIVLPLKVGRAKLSVSRDRQTGRLKASFKNRRFSFKWSDKIKKWVS